MSDPPPCYSLAVPDRHFWAAGSRHFAARALVAPWCPEFSWVFNKNLRKNVGNLRKKWENYGENIGKHWVLPFYLIKRTHHGQRFIATPYKSDWFGWSLLGKQKWDESDGRRQRITLPYVAKDFTCTLKMISSVSPSFFTRGSNIFMFQCSFQVFPI